MAVADALARLARAVARPFSSAAQGWNSGQAKADFARIEANRGPKG